MDPSGKAPHFGKPKRLLPYKWRRALEVMLYVSDLRQASAQLGVPISTLRKWLACKMFAKEFAKRANEVFGMAAAKGQTLIEGAIQVLRENAETAPDAKDRNTAAKYLVDAVARLGESTALADRLGELEAKLDASTGHVPGELPTWQKNAQARMAVALPNGNGNGSTNGNGKH